MLTDELNQSQQQTLLQVGIDALTKNQTIDFQRYTRAVLPLDGYVFWIKDANTPVNSVDGAFHYSVVQQQNDDETIGKNSVVFTTQAQIQGFNNASDSQVWIASFEGIRFAFNGRKSLSAQAGTYHYYGEAINPVMASQIIEYPNYFSGFINQSLFNNSQYNTPTLGALNLGDVIATNSLPIWIGLKAAVQIYPAMLVPSNLTTPYGAVDITNTTAMQSTARYDALGNRWQMMRETAKITFYGLRNNEVLDFLDFVLKYVLNYDAIGITNIPVPVDEKRGQSELGILAQKKSIEFEVCYYQARMAIAAQQQILQAIPSFTFQ